jgi:hypothetical protein
MIMGKERLNLYMKNQHIDDGMIEKKFYNSETCKGISDSSTGMFTFAPGVIIELFEEEMALQNN